MSMLLFVLHKLWSIIDDSGSVVSSVVSSHPALLSFPMLAGNVDRALRTASEGPVVLALGFLDRQVIDTGQTTAHQPIRGELPVFIAIGPEPVARVIMPLIRE